MPIIGGTTFLFPAEVFFEVDAEAVPQGDASVGSLMGEEGLFIPISGGFLDTETNKLIIEHDGSSILFPDEDTGASVVIGDFVIDTEAASVTGFFLNVLPDGTTTELLFEIGAPEDGVFPLSIAEDIGNTAGTIFEEPELPGLLFLFAVVDPEFGEVEPPDVSAVPLPAGGLSLLTALALFGAGVPWRRRRAA